MGNKLGTIHKLRRQLGGEGGQPKTYFCLRGGEGGSDKTYVGKFQKNQNIPNEMGSSQM